VVQRNRVLQTELRSQKIKGDLIPESAPEEIICELQALFARHRINFEFLQLSAFLFQLFLPVVPVAASVKTKLGRGGSAEE